MSERNQIGWNWNNMIIFACCHGPHKIKWQAGIGPQSLGLTRGLNFFFFSVFRMKTSVNDWSKEFSDLCVQPCVTMTSFQFTQMINQLVKVLTLQTPLILHNAVHLWLCPLCAFSVVSFLKQTIGLYWFPEHHSQDDSSFCSGSLCSARKCFLQVPWSVLGETCQGERSPLGLEARNSCLWWGGGQDL